MTCTWIPCSIRGSLTSMVMLSVNLGVLVGYILSTYLAYHVVPFLAIILPIAYFLANLLLPETAPYLLKHKQPHAAETSFKYYQNQRRGMGQASKADFDEMRLAIDAQQAQNTTALTYKDLSKHSRDPKLLFLSDNPLQLPGQH